MTPYTVEFERGAQTSFKKMDPQHSWIKKNLLGTVDLRHRKGFVSNRRELRLTCAKVYKHIKKTDCIHFDVENEYSLFFNDI